MGNKRIQVEAQKSHNMQNRRILVSSLPLKLPNERMPIYPLLVIRPWKTWGGNYTQQTITVETN